MRRLATLERRHDPDCRGAVGEEFTALAAEGLVSKQPIGSKTVTLDLKGEGFIHIDGGAVTNDELCRPTARCWSAKDDLGGPWRSGRPGSGHWRCMTRQAEGATATWTVAMTLQPLLARARE